jgi:hypothetical protein
MSQLLAHLFGDYILQSDWMAQNKTKADWPAFVHALVYSLCFLPLCFRPVYTPITFHWLAWMVILLTHFLIDRFRLARYVVWAKNWLGPWKHWLLIQCGLLPNSPNSCKVWISSDESMPLDYVAEVDSFYGATPPLRACPTGYPPSTPIWLSMWLLIVADNTLHLAINYAALRWL